MVVLASELFAQLGDSQRPGFPRQFAEIMNKVLAAERMSQVQMVEARTKAEVQKIESQSKAEAHRWEAEAKANSQRLAAQGEGEIQRLQTQAEITRLQERERTAQEARYV